MNTGDLIRHLKKHKCELLREGKKHAIWWNPKNGLRTAVPRHPTVYKGIARKVCKELEIPLPPGI